MRINSRMSPLVGGGWNKDVALPEDLEELVRAGWVIGPAGAILLKGMWGSGWRQRIEAGEVGGYEYEVNDAHGTLSDLAGDMTAYLPRAAERGLAFAHRMLGAAADLPGAETLVGTVGVHVDHDDEGFLSQGVTIRFFTYRGDFPDWFEDLEPFAREALAVLDRSDVR